MPSERENFYQPLTFVDYNVAGNVFRAYYDADQKLVFVIDYVISDIKPNVLLVINPVGDRKWDDILMNDYGVVLETVRPKKNNKYQKLDVEYAGLAQYDSLVRAHATGADLNSALAELANFRNVAAQRAAIERLDAAELTATRARETIERTEESIADLQAKLKALRAKLAEQRSEIGKEPTKKSAAKILRTEAQIEATNSKIARAKRRLIKAQNRLAIAHDDADIARGIIDRLKDLTPVYVPAMPQNTDVAVVKPTPVPVVEEKHVSAPVWDEVSESIEEDEYFEQEEEVKPLFTENPNFMNDDIAFKPVDFGNMSVEYSSDDVETVTDDTDDDFSDVYSEPEKRDEISEETEPLVVKPLSFAPPVETIPMSDFNQEYEESDHESETFPVVNSFSSFDNKESEKIDSELLGGTDFPPIPSYSENVQESETVPFVPQPIVEQPVVQMEEPAAPVAAARPEVVVAPVTDVARPVSPISGDEAVLNVAPVNNGSRPTKLYYVLLLVLIVLSIFTLWMYQKSVKDTMPELGAKIEPVVEVVEEKEPVAEIKEPVVEPESVVVEPVAEPEPVVIEPVAEPEPVVIEPVVEPEPAVVEPVVEPEPVIEEPEVKKPIETEEEILAKKPVYNVSQNENMFVADAEYETDVADDTVAVEYDSIADVLPAVEFKEPEIIAAESEVLGPAITMEEFGTEEVESCSDGNPPDEFGCCAGEEFVETEDGEQLCCAIGTDECFPPLF